MEYADDPHRVRGERVVNDVPADGEGAVTGPHILTGATHIRVGRKAGDSCVDFAQILVCLCNVPVLAGVVPDAFQIIAGFGLLDDLTRLTPLPACIPG